MSKKYCQSCGKRLMSSMLICPQCGSKFFTLEPVVVIEENQTKNESHQVLSETVIPKKFDLTLKPANCATALPVRPWVRYWARFIDYSIFGSVIGFLFRLTAPNYLENTGYILLGFVLTLFMYTFIYVFIEALLLSEVGNTLGKWILKVRVNASNGQKITFNSALKRSFNVWLRGNAAGIPIVCAFASMYSCFELKKNGVTKWDKDSGFIVTHEKIGIFRIIIAAVVILIFGIATNMSFQNGIKSEVNRIVIMGNN